MTTIVKKKRNGLCKLEEHFISQLIKQLVQRLDLHKWARVTERLIELGQYVDITEANKTILRQLLERHEREVFFKKEVIQNNIKLKN